MSVNLVLEPKMCERPMIPPSAFAGRQGTGGEVQPEPAPDHLVSRQWDRAVLGPAPQQHTRGKMAKGLHIPSKKGRPGVLDGFAKNEALHHVALVSYLIQCMSHLYRGASCGSILLANSAHADAGRDQL